MTKKKYSQWTKIYCPSWQLKQLEKRARTADAAGALGGGLAVAALVFLLGVGVVGLVHNCVMNTVEFQGYDYGKR
jgi:hypothetical protein